ncbi:MAG: hypothetical protein V7K25_19010 [Nostoc sp.]
MTNLLQIYDKGMTVKTSLPEAALRLRSVEVSNHTNGFAQF